MFTGVDISWDVFIWAGLIAVSIAILTVSYQFIRAALLHTPSHQSKLKSNPFNAPQNKNKLNQPLCNHFNNEEFPLKLNFSSMLRHNLLLIYKGFKRHKGTFCINLIGLSSGLVSALFIYLWSEENREIN